MVKLKNNDRALDSVIKGIFVAVRADPAEERLLKMISDLFFPNLPGGVWQIEQELFCDVEDELLLLSVQFGDENTFVRDDAVVPESAAEVTLVVLIPPVDDEIPRLEHARIM